MNKDSATFILSNINVLTMSSQKADSSLDSACEMPSIIQDASVVVSNGVIQFVGKRSELPSEWQSSQWEHFDGNNCWVTPGLIDCHTHLVYGGNRANEFMQRLNGISYQQIAEQGGGILSTVKATRQATEQELFDIALKRAQAWLEQGVTTLEIKSGYGLDYDTEKKLLSVIQQLKNALPITIKATFLGAHAVPPEFSGRADDYLDLVTNKMLPDFAQENLVDAVDGFCENIGFNTAQMEKLMQKSKQLNVAIKLHAEQLSNQKGSVLAAKYGALSVDHLEFLCEEGVKAIAQSGTVAVLLPGAYYFLRETQLPPIELLRKSKVAMAIATDSNPGSSPCSSLLLMLNMACTLFKLTPFEALQAVTLNAAKALGISDKTGSLEAGKQADMALWDIHSPEELCYWFGSAPCIGAISRGKWSFKK